MDKQKALALKNFVLEAEEVFQSIFEMRDLYWSADFEVLKKKYSEAEFDRYYDEFEDELRANLLKYSNHTFIKAYLKSVFQDACRYVDVEEEKAAQIIEKDFETEFMLKLLDSITVYFDNFNFFSQISKGAYRPISEYFKELEDEGDDDKTDGSETHGGPKLSPEHKESFLTLLLDKIDSGVFVMDGMKGGEAKKAIIDAFGTFLGEDLAGLKKQLATQKQKVIPINVTQKENTLTVNSGTKTFENYLLHKNKLELANALKAGFVTEKSKTIRILIEVLKKSEPPVLAIANGEKKAFYEAMKLFFNRDIGTYNSVFDYLIKDNDVDIMNVMKARLNFILEQIK